MIRSRLSSVSTQSIYTEDKNAMWLRVRVVISSLCAILFFTMAFFITSTRAEESVHQIWLNDGDGLRNGGFEHWVEGEPVFWNISPHLKAILSRKPDTPRKGNTALGYSGSCKDCWAATELKFDQPPAGLTLLFTVQARTTVTDSLYTFVEHDGMNERALSPKAHPGDGQWHTLEQAMTFPTDFSETRVSVGFSYANQSEDAPLGVLANARVYVLPDVRKERREIIRNTQFRHWNDGVPAGWRVLKGKISRSIETSEETSSLRLDAPNKPDEDAAKLQLPLELYAIDAGKTLRIRFTTKGPEPVLRHAIFGRVEGKMVPFAYGTGRKKGYASITPSETWTDTETDFLVPENLGSRSALLLLQMNPSATKPVDIQHISATVIPVDPEE